MRAAAAALVLGLAIAALPVRAAENAAAYRATWAGLPAGEIVLRLREEAGFYRDEIAIRSVGLARLMTHFRSRATAEGRLVGPGMPAVLPAPRRYDAFYDLRKRRDRRLSMRFAAAANGANGAVTAERGPDDTSRKPPLNADFRRNVVDPLSALTAIREALRRGVRGPFTVPVYDGARRFDVVAKILPRQAGERVLRLDLTLRPIAGFKGETSEDGDPDSAPRPVQLSLSDDARLMPLSMSVPLYYLPLVVELRAWCAAAADCGR